MELDDLFKKSPLPQAPAWFEAKTLARLRREKTAFVFPSLFKKLAFAVASLTVAGWIAWNAFDESPSPQQKEIFAALDAVQSYEEDQLLWDEEI
jgi:hypothetical protein